MPSFLQGLFGALGAVALLTGNFLAAFVWNGALGLSIYWSRK